MLYCSFEKGKHFDNNNQALKPKYVCNKDLEETFKSLSA